MAKLVLLAYGTLKAVSLGKEVLYSAVRRVQLGEENCEESSEEMVVKRSCIISLISVISLQSELNFSD
jgi:hypothetical protein